MTKRFVICKSEQCLVCDHLISSKEDNDELEIVCALELDDCEENDELETCPEFQSDRQVIDLGQSNPEDEGLLSRNYSMPVTDNLKENSDMEHTDEKINKYAWVGDSLVESERGELELSGALVEAWNYRVAEEKQNTQRLVNDLTTALDEKLNAAKEMLINSGGAIDLIDDLFPSVVGEDPQDTDLNWDDDELEADEVDSSFDDELEDGYEDDPDD